MSRHRMFSLLTLAAILALSAAALPAWQEKEEKEEKGDKDKKELSYVRLRIEVVGGEKDEPVDNASVYVRYPEDGRSIRKKLIALNLKTNANGVTRVPPIPRGKAMIQVVAKGWKTFGKWYDLEKEGETIKIKLKEPPRWY